MTSFTLFIAIKQQTSLFLDTQKPTRHNAFRPRGTSVRACEYRDLGSQRVFFCLGWQRAGERERAAFFFFCCCSDPIDLTGHVDVVLQARFPLPLSHVALFRFSLVLQTQSTQDALEPKISKVRRKTERRDGEIKKKKEKTKKEKLQRCFRFFCSSLLLLNPDPSSSKHALEKKNTRTHTQHNMELHWDKHHRAYVNNLNGQIKDTELDAVTDIAEVVKATWANGSPTPAFNNAAQVWNHTFFWHSMSPTKSKVGGD